MAFEVFLACDQSNETTGQLLVQKAKEYFLAAVLCWGLIGWSICTNQPSRCSEHRRSHEFTPCILSSLVATKEMSNHFFKGLGNETQKTQLQKSLSSVGLHLDT